MGSEALTGSVGAPCGEAETRLPLLLAPIWPTAACARAARPRTTPAPYWDVYFDTLGAAELAFDPAGISVPFPQRDVHLYKHEGP